MIKQMIIIHCLHTVEVHYTRLLILLCTLICNAKRLAHWNST